ncbi:MAG: TIGR01244 family phosphatase [Alteromonadaceae bacterium TMED7]|nr:MAG: TIGR01244 family phosphatase [Alteromonadaceae bacterium TMED7]|tara:strand:- start:16137 stop:16535 length:399 start_codon:yes stop_codon:yes gene_type:complete
MKIQQLNKSVYIASKVDISDINKLKAIGIQSVINNRPDNEEDGQPLSGDLSEYAASINIDYYYLPIASGHYPVTSVDKLTELLSTAELPVVIFCRTGRRSINLWAKSQNKLLGAQHVLSKVQELGFEMVDIS